MSTGATAIGRWGRLAAALVLAGALAACGGGSSDAPAPAPPATSTPTTSPPASTPAPSLPATGTPDPSQPASTAADPAAGPATPATATTAAAPLAPAGNVIPILMDRGTDGSAINSPFVTVTVCEPGTQNCRTIDHILLDTGSVGLRVAAGALRGLALPAVSAAGGAALAECASFASGYTWGSVRGADVRLGAQLAAGLSVQVMDDPAGVYAAVPVDCASTGAALPDAGSNGILGVGFSVQDCGPACAASTAPGMYFACTGAGCSGVPVPVPAQVAHPVAALASDNNGLAIVLPDVPAGGARSLSGSLVLGIATRDNNQLGAAPVYTASNAGNFTTTYKGRTSSAFIDSGSNGIFFADSGIARCSSGFYCPATALSLSATATGVNGASVAVPFTVENAGALAFGTAAARLGGSVILGRSFDWGLPFFFGRTVFVAISGRATPAGTGPFWAF
ncbi:DUF3443 domain-containing protein [Ramlibacter sp. AN1133]|uniref:DUF3443 domain-containing protein n=1 Tax=Ramlibacter sp. AN1133 TaxID=3133429 RepID=UPI0030C32C72